MKFDYQGPAELIDHFRKMIRSRSRVASTGQAPGMLATGPLGQGRPLGREAKVRLTTSRDHKLRVRLQRLRLGHRDLCE